MSSINFLLDKCLSKRITALESYVRLAMVFKSVDSRDAIVELTGRYLQRLLKIVASLTFAACLILNPAFANSDQKPSVAKKTYDLIIIVEKENSKGKHDQALNRLLKFIPSLQADSYDKAVCLKLLAYTYLQQDNIPKAIDAFEETIRINEMPDDQRPDIHRQLANLYLSQEQFSKSLEHILVVIDKRSEVTPEDHIMAGYALVQMGRFSDAQTYAETAISMSASPKLNWLQLLSAIYYELKEYSKGADVVLKILSMNPGNPAPYWQQLASFYSLAANEQRSLSVLELANYKGLFNQPRQYLHLASLFRYQNTPRYAAQLLDYAIKNGKIEKTDNNWKQTGDAWWDAREYENAINAYAHLSHTTDSANIFQQIARYYQIQRKWKPALNWLEKLVVIQPDKNIAMTLYHTALCHLELDDKQAAKKALLLGLSSDPSSSLARQINRLLDSISD